MAIYLFKGKSKLERSHIGQIIMSTTLNTQAKVIELYGGTSWTKIEGRFLLGASSSYPVNATGGEATHTLTIDEMPSHTHSGNTGTGYTNFMRVVDTSGTTHEANTVSGYSSGGYEDVTDTSIFPGGNHWHSFTTESTGGGQPHNNMPPYKAVYIWERTA
jgi:microcystin-dependent protein